MTDKEKAVVMAFTGATMLTEDKFDVYHKYIQDICGRSIWTHELADYSVIREIKDKSREDFINICKSEDPLDLVLKIIDRAEAIYDGEKAEQVIATLEWVKSEVLSLKGGE